MKRLKSAASGRSKTPLSSARTGRTNRTSSTTKSGKGAIQYPCIACQREGNTIEATNYCTECVENLCANCVKQHQKFPTMKSHKILGESERRSTKDVSTPAATSSLECTEHPGKVVDMYCADHNELWCGACIAINHRKCSNTMLLLDAAKGITNTEEYLQVHEGSQKAKQEILALKKNADKALVNIEQQKSMILTQIKDFRKKIDKALDDMEQDTVKEIENASNRLSKQKGDDVKKCNDVLSSLEALTGLLSSASKGITEEEEPAIFVGVKRAKQRIEECERILTFRKYTMTNEQVIFTPDNRILDWLMSLGKLGAFSYQQAPYTATLIGNFNVRQPMDKKECDIFGCALLHDGRVLLTDWDNKTVKLLDRSYYVVEQAVLTGNPDDICCINPQEAVVSLTMQKKLQFISVGKNITLTRTLNTEESCRGIAYHEGEIFVVCGGFKNEESGKIRVYSIDGNLSRIIEKNNSGQSIFASPISIAIASEGKLYHVTDGQRGIVTLTNKNDVVSVVSDNDTSWPCGICVDHNENTLICNGKSSNVIQMCGLNKIATLLTHSDGVKNPHSICYDINNLRLILTMDKCKFINVYQLQGPSISTVKQIITPRVTIAEAENETEKETVTKGKTPKPTTKPTNEPKTNKESKLKQDFIKTKTETKTNIEPKPKEKTNTNRKVTQRTATMTEIKLKQKSEAKTENAKLDKVHTQMEKIAIADENIANDLEKLLTADNRQITAKDLRSNVHKVIDANKNRDIAVEADIAELTANGSTTQILKPIKPVTKEKTTVMESVTEEKTTVNEPDTKEKAMVTAPVSKEKTRMNDESTQDNDTKENPEYSLKASTMVKSPKRLTNGNASSKPERTNSMFSLKTLNKEKTTMKETKTSPRKTLKSAVRNK